MSATSGSAPGSLGWTEWEAPCVSQPAHLLPLLLQEGVLEPNPVRNFLDDPRRRGGPLEEPERDRREGSRRHGRNWGGSDFERVRSGLEHERQVGAAASQGCALAWLGWQSRCCFLCGVSARLIWGLLS